MQSNIGQTRQLNRYESDSDHKCLIYIGLLACLFSEHDKQSLDFQGPAGRIDQLSTKLSTESWDGW